MLQGKQLCEFLFAVVYIKRIVKGQLYMGSKFFPVRLDPFSPPKTNWKSIKVKPTNRTICFQTVSWNTAIFFLLANIW